MKDIPTDKLLFKGHICTPAGDPHRGRVKRHLLGQRDRSVSPTVNEWISMLTASYIVIILRPYHNNIGKTLAKMPKLYFCDTGLLCYLMGIDNAEALAGHPLRGAIFENAAVIELIKQRYNSGREPRVYFYREHRGREVDAVSVYGGTTHRPRPQALP